MYVFYIESNGGAVGMANFDHVTFDEGDAAEMWPSVIYFYGEIANVDV